MSSYTKPTIAALGILATILGTFAFGGITLTKLRDSSAADVAKLRAAQNLRIQQESRIQKMAAGDESVREYRNRWEARRATYAEPGSVKQIIARHARSNGVSILRDTLPDQKDGQRELTYECSGTFEPLLKWLSVIERDIDYLSVSEMALLGRDDSKITMLVTFKLPNF